MSLTVCMVVYNEEKHLSLIEENICILRENRNDLRIMLIDNASTDLTSVSLQKIAKQYNVDYILRDLNHLAQARQMAVELCQTDWIGFIDADCQIDGHWLKRVLQKIQQVSCDVAAFGGPWKMAGPWKSHYEALFSTFLGHFGLVYLQSSVVQEKNVKHLPTANIVYRRKDILKVGGFNSKNGRVGEDLHLNHKLTNSAAQILFYPEMKISHFLPTSLLSWAYKMFIYGQARGEVLWNYKTFSYVSCIPFFSFVFLGSLLIGSPTLFIGLASAYLLGCLLVAVYSSSNFAALRVFFLLVQTHFFYSLGVVYGFLRQMLQGVSRQTFFLPNHREQEPEGA